MSGPVSGPVSGSVGGPVRRTLVVRRVGPLCLVQDRGRPGLAHLGVPRAGALDQPAADLANRLVGNPPGAAVLEVLLGGLEVVLEAGPGQVGAGLVGPGLVGASRGGAWVAVTGAAAPVVVAGRAAPHATPVWLAAGRSLRLGTPASGLRSYVAVGGGIDVAPVLGSRSTDTLAGVGPPPVVEGVVLPLGAHTGPPSGADAPRPRTPGPLRIDPGPRADWCGPQVLADLCRSSYGVRSESNRVGLRLDGPPLRRLDRGELPSEGVVLGAVQVPPDGLPVVFLADHPPTGGYPVVAVVRADDLWLCAQLRPGDEVRFSRA